MKRVFMFLMVATLSFAACKKDTPPTNKQLLVKTWKVNEAYVNGQLSTDPSWSSVRLTFKSDGTYTSVAGTDNSNGTWEFNSDQSRVILNKGTSNEETMEILKLDANSYNFKETDGSDVVEFYMIPA